MKDLVAYTRSVRITFADGTQVSRKPGRTLVPAGAPLPSLPATVAASRVRQMACYDQPVTDVRFVYRKRG
jgi:hypothetical protein